MVEIYQEIGDSSEGEIGEELAGGSVEEGSDTVEADITQEIRIVEALLFAATEPVSTDFLAERLPENADVGAVLDEIQSLYEGRGVNLSRVAGKWSLRTAEDLSPHLRIERKVSRKPSRAAVRSLAIIAYHQPVTRSEVEEIRGVSVSKGSFDVLLEAGWIKPVGRRRTPGRPTTWGTTLLFSRNLDWILWQICRDWTNSRRRDCWTPARQGPLSAIPERYTKTRSRRAHPEKRNRKRCPTATTLPPNRRTRVPKNPLPRKENNNNPPDLLSFKITTSRDAFPP